jgi:hypothetical protein
MVIGYDVYDRFTMEHFPMRQTVTLTTKIYCSRPYVYKRQSVGVVYGLIRVHCTLMKFLSIFQCITPKPNSTF